MPIFISQEEMGGVTLSDWLALVLGEEQRYHSGVEKTMVVWILYVTFDPGLNTTALGRRTVQRGVSK